MNADGAATTYTWDGEDRLSAIALPTAGVLTLTYDATGLRRKRQDSSGTTDYLWDLENLLMEFSGGTTEARYTVGEGAYGPIVSSRRGATSRFLMTDALGSVVGLLDPSEAESDSYIYQAFGDLAASSGSSVKPFLYVGSLGYYNESDASLSYVRARWFRPSTGSWLSVDPVEDEARYLYVGGRPTTVSDGSGLQPDETLDLALLPYALPGPPSANLRGRCTWICFKREFLFRALLSSFFLCVS